MATSKANKHLLPHMLAPDRKPPLPGLTGIRTFLAVGILFFHYTPPHATYIRPMIEAGFTYIGCFLLISGFVLSYNYAHRADTIKVGRFYAARGSRLYPVYLLSLLVSLGMLHAEWLARPHGEFWTGVVLTPLLLQGWSPTLATFWNTVAWTLSTEAMLYLAFPFINRAKWWPKDAQKLLILFFTFWCCELVLPITYMALNPDHLTNIDRYSSAYWLRLYKYTPLAYVPIFMAGVTLGRLNNARALQDRTKLWMTIGAGIFIVLCFYLAVPHLPYVLLHGGLLTPVFATLIVGLTGVHWISRAFGWGPMGIFGRASFCLYLLHFNLWNVLHDHHAAEHLHLQAFDPWIYYALILLAAYVAYRWVEHPVQSYLLTNFVYKTPKPPVPESPAQTPLG
ncbi:acyltransferase family protein [Terriglobus aquaticus]|uniref:Acyltransferase family protein n=1 Tax=Terriglobus aquaticus TaxID=940139 RepID=A0ABW9KH61_9BACT|nr:acyltransferase [Terriglobus aquaticus]